MEIIRSDWPLLALHFAGEKGLTPAQLQKTIFLLQKAFPKNEELNYNFQPYNYGPFDSSVYQDVESLADGGLTELKKRNGCNWNTYHISLLGEESCKKLIKKYNGSIFTYLKDLVHWVQSVSFQELISSIYKKYPEYKKNSIFRG